jgi:hypothetical protein
VKLTAACLTALLVFLCTSFASAADATKLDIPMFPLNELKAGLKGTGHTVIRGTKIETFDVEVIDLVPDGGFDGGPMVLARFSGPVIEQSNGIAAGYSGSPVYINGKLLGAVSSAIPMSDTHIGGITPIQSMLSSLPDGEEVDSSKNTVLPPSSNNGTPLDKNGNLISWVGDAAAAQRHNDAELARGGSRFEAVRCDTPLLTSGVSPLVMTQLQKMLGEHYGKALSISPIPMGKAGEMGLLAGTGDSAGDGKPGLLMDNSKPEMPLKAGDAFSVSMIQGDLEVYAIGTVTYADKQGRVLLFGHPFPETAFGNTNMPMGKAYITWTHKAVDRAFKEGVRLNTVGTMTKNHLSGCGGSVNLQPDTIPVKIKVNDIDRGTTQTLKLEVIRNPDLTPALIAAGMSEAVQRELDRQPGGTLKMSYHIEGTGLKEPLRRENYYSNDSDVITDAAFDLYPLASLLETNIYRKVTVTKVEVLCEITRNRINASIDDAKIVADKDKTPAPMANPGTPPAAPNAAPTPALPNEPDKNNPLDDTNPPSPTPPVTPPAPAPALAGPLSQLPTFKPGDTIKVKVRLQPYRTEAVWRQFEVKVPEDFPSGNTMVVVHGGGDLISMSEFGGKGRQLFGMGPTLSGEGRDLDSLLDQVESWPLNNELVVTLVRPYDPSQAQQLGQQGSSTNPGANAMGAGAAVLGGGGGPDDNAKNKVDAKYQMEWVIYNGFFLPVNIMSDKDMAAMQNLLQGQPQTGDPSKKTPGNDTKDSKGGTSGNGNDGGEELLPDMESTQPAIDRPAGHLPRPGLGPVAPGWRPLRQKL